MSPSEHYQQKLAEKNFQADPAQQAVMAEFDRLHDDLIRHDQGRLSIKSRLLAIFNKRRPVTGLYLWGGVGRGKTWLMDIFYETLPIEGKHRLHFHRFMRQVHEQLEQAKGQRNPLRIVARKFAAKYQLLCLDEFHVSDITDAMLLHGLLKSLISEGVCFVFTSNIEPVDLYKDGLQRERFVPAINLILQHTTTVEIANGIDHRLRAISKAEVYYTPLNTETRQQLEQCFLSLVPCTPKADTILTINHRPLPCYRLADDVIWFDFELLFNSPRAIADYIELARQFHTVIISDVPVLNERNEDKARRFIQLMDEFYDRKVKLILSAETEPAELYQGRLLQFDFKRTLSRLEEMQSPEYLALPHKA